MRHSRTLALYLCSTLIWLCLCVAALGVVSAIELRGPVLGSDVNVLLTYAILGVISISSIASAVKQHPYSLNMVHWVTVFVFFFLAPLAQYLQDKFPTRLVVGQNTHDILYVNALLIIWTGCYGASYCMRMRRNQRRMVVCAPRGDAMAWKRIRVTGTGVRLSLLLSFVALTVFLAVFGTSGLTTRGEYERILFGGEIDSTPVQLILSNVIRGIPVLFLAAVLVTKRHWKRRIQWWTFVVMGVVINLIINNPLAAARYWGGSLMVGFSVLLWFSRRRSGVWFTAVLVAGLVLVAPAINVARQVSGPELSVRSFSLADPIRVLTAGDLDAYEMLVHTVQYTRGPGTVTWGHQFVGSLFFWIPRSIWPSKPIGSGRLVAAAFGFENVNVSCPLPAEGYVNFLTAGVVALACGLGWILASLDHAYWRQEGRPLDRPGDLPPSLLHVVYPFLLGFLVFIMRGDMMSSVSYAVLFVVGGLPLLMPRLSMTRPRLTSPEPSRGKRRESLPARTQGKL